MVKETVQPLVIFHSHHLIPLIYFRRKPYIRLQMSIKQEDYDHFGFPLQSLQNQAFTSAMADTGCQSCLAGFRIIKKLGLSTRDLIPVDLRMHAADNHNIHILGAAILRLSAKSGKGEERSTRQMVYVTNSTDKFFLSREACSDLGIISHNFPAMDEVKETSLNGSIGAATNSTPPSQHGCQCLKRTKPPPIPTSLPYPATEANREKLQQYLLDYYSSSTFNVCEHQTLPLMEGPPMRLMIDPQASPTAHHSPIPVPFHWQDDVKDGLDRDVKLGVLEPVQNLLHGATEWLSVPRKMAHPEGPSISSHSTSMPPGKRTTPNHPSPFHKAR